MDHKVENVWPAEVAIHKGFVEGLICNRCRNIPKQGFGRVCENNHIYCQICIEQLMKQNTLCTVNNCKKNMNKTQILPKVLQHMIDELQVTCYSKYCKWRGTLSQLSNHLMQCTHYNNDNNLSKQRRTARLSSDSNIIFHDKHKKKKQQKFFARRRTSSTNNRADALKAAQKYVNKNENKDKRKKRNTEIGCPLLSQGCTYKMDIKQISKIDEHFKDYQHKHLMLIINDYQDKYQSLENTVLILQSQMKFVLNELNLANKKIESQSNKIEYLNNKINVNIMSKTPKPPKPPKPPKKEEKKQKDGFIISENIINNDIGVLSDEMKDESFIPSLIPSNMFSDSYLNENIVSPRFSSEDKIMECIGNNTVIIDNGSGFIKYGYSNYELPETFPTVFGYGNKWSNNNNNNNKYYIGNKAIKNEKFLNMENNIISNGIINDW
eukprot:367442_1